LTWYDAFCLQEVHGIDSTSCKILQFSKATTWLLPTDEATTWLLPTDEATTWLLPTGTEEDDAFSKIQNARFLIPISKARTFMIIYKVYQSFRLSILVEMQQAQITKENIMATLEKDVRMLKDSMDIIHALVHEQQESIDSIEDFIHLTKQDVKAAETALVVADTYSIKKNSTEYMYYLSGLVGIVGVVMGLTVLF